MTLPKDDDERKVLVIDDDEGDCCLVEDILNEDGLQVVKTSTLEGALDALEVVAEGGDRSAGCWNDGGFALCWHGVEERPKRRQA